MLRRRIVFSTLTWLVELDQVVDDDVRHPEILIMIRNIIIILDKSFNIEGISVFRLFIIST